MIVQYTVYQFDYQNCLLQQMLLNQPLWGR